MKKFNKIMGVFTKTITELEKLEGDCIENAIKTDEKINLLAAEGDAYKAEAHIAGATAEKLRTFIEVK